MSAEPAQAQKNAKTERLEAVNEVHSGKSCKQASETVLDACLAEDLQCKVARKLEMAVKDKIAGEPPQKKVKTSSGAVLDACAEYPENEVACDLATKDSASETEAEALARLGLLY